MSERALPARSSDMEITPEPCLSVVMSCFDEAATIKVIIDRVLDSPLVRELVIVDDGSTDDALQTALGFDDPRVRVFAQPINFAKGAALRRGFREVQSPYVIVQDADLEYERRSTRPCSNRCSTATPTSCMARGSSAVTRTGCSTTGTPSATRFLTTTSNVFTNLHLTDMGTCCSPSSTRQWEAGGLHPGRGSFSLRVSPCSCSTRGAGGGPSPRGCCRRRARPGRDSTGFAPQARALTLAAPGP